MQKKYYEPPEPLKPGKPLRLKYLGESFGAASLTDGKVYEGWADPDISGMYRVIDDSGEDYLYSMDNPAPLDGSSKGGKWKILDN